jgi:hypothetical protein
MIERSVIFIGWKIGFRKVVELLSKIGGSVIRSVWTTGCKTIRKLVFSMVKIDWSVSDIGRGRKIRRISGQRGRRRVVLSIQGLDSLGCQNQVS